MEIISDVVVTIFLDQEMNYAPLPLTNLQLPYHDSLPTHMSETVSLIHEKLNNISNPKKRPHNQEPDKQNKRKRFE